MVRSFRVFYAGRFLYQISARSRQQRSSSSDGKSIYAVRQDIQIYNTSGFELVKTIELASAAAPPGTETLSLNLMDDPNGLRGRSLASLTPLTSYVHRDIFGLAYIAQVDGDLSADSVGPSEGAFSPDDDAASRMRSMTRGRCRCKNPSIWEEIRRQT